jgi:hypothetical protein
MAEATNKTFLHITGKIDTHPASEFATIDHFLDKKNEKGH